MDNTYMGKPLASNLGQFEHQISYTENGERIDRDEGVVEVVDQNGLPVVSEDEAQLKEYIKSSLTSENIIDTIDEDGKQTLLKLLAIQDNNHPSKKGGINIAYRTDALIMNCKMDLSADENIVFDAILGVISSYPEYDTYRIMARDFLEYVRYKNPKQIYESFSKGADELSGRTLDFVKLGKNSKKDKLKIPWFKALRYHSPDEDDGDAYIYFKPSDFFKALALAAKIVHGAYGRIEVTTQLTSKYAIALYWLLESKKEHKSYPGATPGEFEMSVEDVRFHFGIPDTYRAGDIKRRVFDESLCINDIAECDLTFSYETKTKGKKILGFIIRVQSKKGIGSKGNVPQLEADPFYDQISMLLTVSGLTFEQNEVQRIYDTAKRLNKDSAYIMEIIVAFKQRMADTSMEHVEEPVSYFCKMIENGAKPIVSRQKNSFNDIPQNNYDFEELESKLLDN